jgi:XRE family transcriptional regulator, master regulator for biofilm formation
MPMTFGERLEHRRKEQGWSQAELARRAAIPQGLISRLERGLVKEPGITVVRRLARSLGTTTDYLVGMYDESELSRHPVLTGAVP